MTREGARGIAAPKDAREEVFRRLGLDGRLAFFPVRHHSPTCAAKLEQFLPQFAPDVILIEAPARFEEQIEALLDEESVAPFALVAQTGKRHARFYAARRGDAGRAMDEAASPVRSYYPFCDYSPELVALRFAAASGAEARFIDRLDQGIGANDDDLDALGERLGGAPDAPLARSRFTEALCKRAGCRDFDELWEVLFEQGGWDESPARWAESVGAYALATRSTYGREELEGNGTIARERFMAAKIAEALARGGRVLVVAGAVHAVALGGARDEITRRGRVTKDDTEAEILLVPYTFPRLDALLGYAPGMSGPGFYQHVWEARGEADPFARAAEKTLLEAIRLARAEGDLLGPADAIAALAFARDLAALRDRPRIGRTEVIEAATSCLVKGELEVSGRRVVAALGQALRGHRVGKLGPKAGASPIALDFRRAAEALELFGESSRPLAISLDLKGSVVARRRSFFLHRAAWLELGFGKQLTGPDAGLGEGGLETKERWSVVYTPEVDARLAELAAEGASVEEAATRQLARAARAASGRAADVATLVGRAVLMGLEGVCRSLAPRLAEALHADQDPASLLGAARRLRRIGSWRARLSKGRARWLDELGREAYEAGTRGLPRLSLGRGARAAEVLALLVDLRDATLAPGDVGPGRALVVAKARDAREAARASSVLLLGALDGLLYWLGEARPSALAADFESSRDNPAARGEFLEGLLAIAPRALTEEPELLGALVDHVTHGSFESFLASLPSLRRALGRLDARDVEALGARAASKIGLQMPEMPVVLPLPPDVVARLSAWERRFLEEESRWADPPRAPAIAKSR